MHTVREDLVCSLTEAGWHLCRRGKHAVYESDTGTRLTVPNKLNDKHFGNQLLRKAGIKGVRF